MVAKRLAEGPQGMGKLGVACLFPGQGQKVVSLELGKLGAREKTAKVLLDVSCKELLEAPCGLPEGPAPDAGHAQENDRLPIHPRLAKPSVPRCGKPLEKIPAVPRDVEELGQHAHGKALAEETRPRDEQDLRHGAAKSGLSGEGASRSRRKPVLST